jgi:PAS domain S-box-containing protein
VDRDAQTTPARESDGAACLARAAHAGQTGAGPPRVAALRIAIIYAVVGCAWILFSDVLAQSVLGREITRRYFVQTVKGWAFVAVTAVMLYVLIRRSFAAIAASDLARRETEARTRLLVEQVRDYAIFTLDDAGHVTSWNRGAQQITDWGEADIIGKSHAIFYPPADAAADKPARDLAEARASGSFETEAIRVRQDGTEFWANVQLTRTNAPAPAPARTPARAPGEFLCVVRDVTERRRAQDALRQMNQALSAIINAAPLAIVSIDHDRNVSGWNPAAETIFGWSADEVIGKPLPFIPDEQAEAFDRIYRQQQAGRRLTGVEVVRRRKTGGLLELSLWTAPLLDSAGAMIGSMGIFADLTERRQAEAQVRQLNETLEKRVAERTAQLEEANEELAAYSYTISHDLRAPLRSLQQLAADLLATQSDKLDDAGRSHALRIIGAAARLQRLIEDVLEFSRASRGEIILEPVSLVLIVHELLGRLERDPEYRSARITIEEPLGWVRANPLILQQVVLNLLINAITFVAPDQRASVVISGQTCGDHGQWLRLRIEDNGVGVQPQDRERIFEVFQRLPESPAHPGAGLGLAVARRGIQRMGGTIGVDAAPSGGSVFWIELPQIPGGQ